MKKITHMTTLGRWSVIGAMVAGSATAFARPAPQPPALESRTWKVDGVERTALVAAPHDNPSPKSIVPVVLVFHGHGGTSQNAARTFRIHEAWPEALVLYPQGLPTEGQIVDLIGAYSGWQHLAGMDHDRDLHFVDEMLSWAGKQYKTDESQTFAAGHSNGGSMVYVLWTVKPDKFAAFAPASSVFPAVLLGGAKAKPAFIVAGRQDALVPFALQQWSLDGVLKINHVEQADHEWIGNARRHAPLGDSRGAEVIAYVHSGGHPLPSDAGELMVKFFKEIAATSHHQ
jgi:polyhydroxybutyrate depolymerase